LGSEAEITAEEFPIPAVASSVSQQTFDLHQLICMLPLNIKLHDTLTEIEKNLIERAMEEARGVQAEAARMLGLSRSDMGYKVAKYAIER
jgi:transcriptional regulator with GAF, ATPase, and Fis domain